MADTRTTLFLALAALALTVGSCTRSDLTGAGAPESRSATPRIPYPRPADFANVPTPTPTATATPTPVPTPSSYPGACHEIYDPDVVPTFELEIAPADWQALMGDFAADRNVYHPAIFRFEGEEYSDARVRYRGNNSRCGEKLQLAIAFHIVNPDGRFRGLRRLDIDHGSCRVLHERIAFDFAREAGVVAPCANNVRVVVNGEYYGLYANLEHVNREFLKRNFDLPKGNLYKAGRRKNNEEDPDTSDYKHYRDAADVETLDSLVDLDQAVRMWAVEALLPASDNYWYFGRNYYLYNHPERGFVYIPNDYDHAVPLGWNWDWAPMPPGEHPTTFVLADPYWRGRFLDELAAAHARFRPEWHAERIDRYWAQTRDHIAQDPFLSAEFSDEEIEKLKEVFRRREALIGDFLRSEGYPVD